MQPVSLENSVVEFSFGVIPLRKKGEAVEVFLVHHKAGHWGFPKGHKEGAETPKETACRELKEETGLQVANWTSFAFKESYQVERLGKRTPKEVTYFPAWVEGDLCLQRQEIQEGKWVLLKDVKEHLTFKPLFLDEVYKIL
jgi:8-oxo-dGTP pyrophosphatase MutT (NUDIX family)